MSYMNNIPLWKREHKQDPSYDPNPINVKVINKLTERQVYDLTKAEQILLINKLRSKKEIYQIKYPKYEKDRVNLILDLQK